MTFHDTVNPSTIAISRSPLVALLTNAGSSADSPTYFTVNDTIFNVNETLVDILTCNTFSATSTGGINVESFYGDPQIVLPASKLSKKGPLCPAVAQGVFAVSGALAKRAPDFTWPVAGLAMVYGLWDTFL